MEQITNPKRHRSPAYPQIDLEKSIPLTQKLYEKFSDDSFSRDSAILELGLGKGGSSHRKIAALVQFGLLDRKGSGYKITDLAKNIIFPGEDENLKTKTIVSAVKSPKLYKSLIQSYEGKQFPTALHHRLIKDEGFNQSVAEKVAKDFRKSVEFAGILKNGIITSGSGVDQENLFENPGTVPSGIIPIDTINRHTKIPEQSVGQSIGVSIPLGEITVTFSEKLKREVARGKFANLLDQLEKLGKEMESISPPEGQL